MPTESVRKHRGSAYITSVTIEQLFGRYTYNLDLNRDLSILYGDNGTGKTTILRLIHNIISPGSGRGHKTVIARTPFKNFSIRFSNGVSLEARRKEVRTGSFELFLHILGERTIRAPYIVNERNAIPVMGANEESQSKLNRALVRATDLRSYYLADDRVFDSDFIDRASHLKSRREMYATREFRHAIESEEVTEGEILGRSAQVAFAMARATAWARRQALHGTSEGSASANTIYTEVVQHLARMPERSDPGDVGSSRQELLNMIGSIAARSKKQSQFGLSPAVNTEDLIRYVPIVPEDVFPLVARILEPYLEGTVARLNALEGTFRTLSFFVEVLNRFLRDKRVAFDVSTGLKIFTTPDGEELNPEVLSSGETQLLTLFCNILSTRERPSVFVIDEPEISLNVKWQRMLVDALLGCAEGSSTQLILASHSIELLTAHKDCVVALEN
ncbi:AAA family ATPase [Streptomyces sp. SAS_276]|uniref:AAA family ATPase n=1 Tax=Streptomyces sp. SAS_276 TaxID=3412745 RepID=UPI00403C6E63